MISTALLRLKRKKRGVTRPFDAAGKRALVFGAVAGNPPSDNFPLLGQELRKPLDIFIINQGNLLAAETADLPAEETARAARPFPIPVSIPIPAPALATGAFGPHRLKRNLLIRRKFFF